MDDFLTYLLIGLIVVALVLLGVFIAHDLNLSGTAVGRYSGVYCDPVGCGSGQVRSSGHIYPGESSVCPESTSVFWYFFPAGKVLIPQYKSYYLLDGSCQITPL